MPFGRQVRRKLYTKTPLCHVGMACMLALYRDGIDSFIIRDDQLRVANLLPFCAARNSLGRTLQGNTIVSYFMNELTIYLYLRILDGLKSYRSLR